MTQKVKLTNDYKKQGVGVGHARIVNKWKMGTVRMRKRKRKREKVKCMQNCAVNGNCSEGERK
jgi:hypothetical protein